MTPDSSAPIGSGLDAVDQVWGGLRPGTSLLLVGRARAGRTALALRSARAAIAAGQTCLLFSPRAADALNATAQSEGFDLAALHGSGRLRVLRIPSAKDLAAKGVAGLESAYRDLAGLAASSSTDRVVIEDLTPLVQFPTFDAFGAAFDSLRAALSGASLVVGLGEPANEPSRRLVETVQGRVDGTARLSTDGIAFEPRVQYSSAPEAAAFDPAPSRPEPTPAPPAIERPAAPEPQPAVPEPSIDAAMPPAAEPASVPETPAAPFAPTAGPMAPASVPPPEPSPAAPYEPSPLASAPPFQIPTPSNDGSSVPIDPPEAPPEAPTEAVPEAPEPASASGLVTAAVEPAPAPDPELNAPSSDPFGQDPGAKFFDNGYLVDSRGATPTPTSPAASAPDVTPPVQPLPPSGGAQPAFSPISTPPPADDAGSAQAALQAAYAARATGTPFLVIAARMEPSQPEAGQFPAVLEGLRKALPAGGAFFADAARLRSILVLPGATQDAAAGVFSTLQQHLQSALGAQAEGTLRAVAAITVPNGEPFGSAQELWTYAVAS